MPALAKSTDDLIGIWQLGSAPRALFFQFNMDRTYRWALGDVTNLEDSPQSLGQFMFEEGLLTFVSSSERALCAGQSGTYEVRLLEQGRLGLFLREDECSCEPEPTSHLWSRFHANRRCDDLPPKPDPHTMLRIRPKETGNAKKATLLN